MKNITILNFSSRNNGNCACVSANLEQFHKNDEVKIFVIDDRIGPCNGCDYECLKPQEKCPNVDEYLSEVITSILRSDLTYMVIPNYCGFPCANYLSFNERSVGFFQMDRAVTEQYRNVNKKFIVISNTENEMFNQATRQQITGEPDVLYLKSSKYGKRSTAGDILESEVARADLEAFIVKEMWI